MSVRLLTIVSAAAAIPDTLKTSYGGDNRIDETSASSTLQGYGATTVALVNKGHITLSGSVYNIKAFADQTMAARYGATQCDGSAWPFGTQPAYVSFCSGTHVYTDASGSGYVATAGHCVMTAEVCASTYVVFGFTGATAASGGAIPAAGVRPARVEHTVS